MSSYITICEKAVRAAGATVQDWIGRIDVRKKGPADLVTQADFASQEIIRRIVLDAFPEHSLLGEEETGPQQAAIRSEYRWITDPLDGTTNYVHRLPHYSVSLALQHNDTVLVGAIYDPNREECFTTALGEGAYLNGRRIRVSQVSALSEALAVVGLPASVRRDSPDLDLFLKAVVRCQAVRQMGSAALNLAYLAAGRVDVVWSFSTKIWDVAAGALMVQEAGGVISAPDGGDFVLENARFLAAANPGLHAQLAGLVRSPV